MKIEECIRRIDKYLHSNDTHPRFVNLQNSQDVDTIIQHFGVGSNIFKGVVDYAKTDENPSISDLFDDLNNLQGAVFLAGFTSHYLLLGEQRLKEFLVELFSYSNAKCHIIVLCYQCEKYLNYSEVKRYGHLIYDVSGTKAEKPVLVFIPTNMPAPNGVRVIDGVDRLSTFIEGSDSEELYVRTTKHKSSYPYSLYQIIEQNDAFEMLCCLDVSTQKLNKSYGTDKQWNYALDKISIYKSWIAYFTELFGNYMNLELIANSWQIFDEKKRWVYFIALKMFKAKNSWCLDSAIKAAASTAQLIRGVYRSILSLEPTDNNFWEYYEERKVMIHAFGKSDVEVANYCELVKSKGRNAIYYLTNTSKTEINLVFEMLDSYALDFKRSEIIYILEHIYPDLYYYLQPYRFKNQVLDSYFQEYKYQKVINKVFPEFAAVVEEQAEKREFNLWLPSRSEKIEAIKKQGTLLYFMDAMGVEYLGYIMEKCRRKHLMAYATICHCELPSITFFNKEFIKIFEEGGATFVPNHNGIKALDDIKHHGQEEFDFQNNQLPTYLARELEIIDEVLEKISTKLSKGNYDSAVMIADHGASRLSVISKKENEWEMAEKGKYSGRCCPKTEINKQPKCSTEEHDFWVLANYDRFKGGRPGNVEVHGGATLEEVVIPIIEITAISKDIEIIMLTPVIEFNTMKKNAVIKFFSTTKLSDVVVRLSGISRDYEVETNDDQTFTIKLDDLRKSGDYLVNVYSNNNEVKSGLKFTASKEGFKEKKLL